MSFRKLKEIKGHAGAVYCCTVNQNHLYTGSADKFVARWLIDEGTQDNFSIQFDQSIYSISYAWENVLAVGLASGALHFFDLNERVELRHFDQHKVGVFSIYFEQGKKLLYVGDADGNLSVWNHDFDLVIYLPLGCGKIRAIRSNSTGSTIIIGGQDGNIRVFETDHFNEIRTINAHEGGCTAIMLDKNEEKLISGGKDALLKSWNIEDGMLEKSIPAHNFAIYDLLLLNGGNTIVSASRDKKIKLWNADDLGFVDRIESKSGGHLHSVNDLHKIDDVTFISCSDDKRVIVWQLDL